MVPVSVAYNDMIIQRYSDNVPCFYKSLCFVDIFCTWRRITTRMIMSNDDGHSANTDRLAENVARMHERPICSSSCYAYRLTKELAFRIEIQREHTLLRFVNANRTNLPHNVIRCFNCANKRAVRHFHVAFDKGECGGELYGGDLADTRNFRRYDLLPCRIDEICRAAKMLDKPMSKIDCTRSFAP